MPRFMMFSPFACLLAAACSTTPAPPVPVQAVPSPALLLPCVAPSLVPSETVRDVVNNSNARQLAFDACNAQHEGLLEWHRSMTGAAPQPGDTMPAGAKSERATSH